ncbi:hypothetical protein SAMN05216316_2988 [Nitrosovibrio sp. Nv6]|nr:hypothetical protein SAMN05216316_2988 [Nitrosovibrio sp. Nv6]
MMSVPRGKVSGEQCLKINYAGSTRKHRNPPLVSVKRSNRNQRLLPSQLELIIRHITKFGLEARLFPHPGCPGYP